MATINGYVRPYNLDESTNTPVYTAPSEREIWHAQFGDYLKPMTTEEIVTVSATQFVLNQVAGKISGSDVLTKSAITFTETGQTVAKDYYLFFSISETNNEATLERKMVNAGTNVTWSRDYETLYETPIAVIKNINPGGTFNFTTGDLEILVDLNFGGGGATNGSNILYFNRDQIPATKALKVTKTEVNGYIDIQKSGYGDGSILGIDTGGSTIMGIMNIYTSVEGIVRTGTAEASDFSMQLTSELYHHAKLKANWQYNDSILEVPQFYGEASATLVPLFDGIFNVLLEGDVRVETAFVANEEGLNSEEFYVVFAGSDHNTLNMKYEGCTVEIVDLTTVPLIKK